MRRPLALITGASGKLGPTLVEAAEAAGYRVAVAVHRHAPKRAGAAGVFGADLSKPGAALRLVRRVEQRQGPIAALIHAAGGFLTGPLLSVAQEDLDAELAVHARAFLGLSQAVVPSMRAIGQGRIVLLSMEGSKTRVFRQVAAHAAAKAAAEVLAQSLAAELRPEAIVVTTLALGPSPSRGALRQALRRTLRARGMSLSGRVLKVAGSGGNSM
ncbi:MAG: SDR family oxidoreductase [Myxococcota bacterium]